MEDDSLKKILPALSSESRVRLARVFSDSQFDGTLSSSEVQSIAQLESRTVEGLMVEFLPLAARLARPPISHFHVGAILHGGSGRLYLGANLEFPGQMLDRSVHAEQSAAANAYMHREQRITKLAVTAAPCGLCRQFLWEMCDVTGLQVLIPGRPATTLNQLLPDAFGPKDLGLARGALPVLQTALDFRVSAPGELSAAALESARMSYAPYSKTYAGVALRTEGGRVYQGSYIENAAYNPSIPPLQVAISELTLAGDNVSKIKEAALVAIHSSEVDHVQSAKTLLASLAPAVDLISIEAVLRG